jgi:Fe-S-cluster containining protein
MNDKKLAAGDFSAWATKMRRVLDDECSAEVPCGGCTACCTSSQFIHIEPDEIDTIAHVPAQLLFRAPRTPPGYLVLGYDARGHCPMLIDYKCSIYRHRPRTCRTYDCRVFPAAGVDVQDEHPAIALQARRWQFRFPERTDQIRHEAIIKAARFLANDESLLADNGPASSTRRAVLALEIHELFFQLDETGRPSLVDPEPETIRNRLEHVRQGARAGTENGLVNDAVLRDPVWQAPEPGTEEAGT